MGGYIITMSPESHIPIWRRFMRSKRQFAKSSLIPLPKTPAEFSPNTLYPEPLVDESTHLMAEVTLATEPLEPASSEPSVDEPTDLMPAITPATESSLPPSEPSVDEPTDLMPAITPAT